MPARLVYSPKVFAFTRNAKGELYNISPYIVSGEIQRNVNQVSTATLILRNPNKVFTTPKHGIAFHPQDPITIYMERLSGFPVRVFTGYLGKTPYLQLQPAIIQLQASCTLKRLLFSYFDPSLPYMISFFEKFGWINTGQGSIINKTSFNAKNLRQNHDSLEDGSISRLLWGILYDIASWDDTDIWIEPLPQGTNGIVRRMLTLMEQFDAADEVAAGDLEAVFNSMLGTTSQGSGSGSSDGNALTTTGNVSGKSNIIPVLIRNAKANGIPPAMAIATCYVESGLGSDMHTAGSSYYGWFQMSLSPSEPYANAGIDTQPTKDEAYDLGWSSAIFCKAAAARVASDPSLNQVPYLQWAMTTQGVTAANNPRYPQTWDGYYKQALADISQYGDSSTTDSPSTKNKSKTTKTKIDPFGGNPFDSFGNSSSDLPYNSVYAQDQSANQDANQSGTGVLAPKTNPNTHYAAIVQAANAMASSGLPYVYGGGHSPDAMTSGSTGYDCSSSVSFVLYAAGLIEASQVFATGSEPGILKSIGAKEGHVATDPGSVTVWVDNTPSNADHQGPHTFMLIGGTSGRYWGTTDGSAVSKQGAGAWLSKGNQSPADANDSNFVPYSLSASLLSKAATYRGKWLTAGSTTIPGHGQSGDGGGGSSSASNTISKATAEAFTQQLDFPSIEDSIVAILLGGEGKGLMHDQALLPFVQQVAQASLRSFMSLPDGSFYAFYPDYFGEFGQHDPYWMIDDIEITSGTIDISDDALATHVYAVGDNSWPIDNSMLNQLFSAGTITIFNAFETRGKGVLAGDATTTGKDIVFEAGEALQFVKRYGARPIVQEFPMVRSSIFEMLMAYQLFMQSWSNQFLSTFTFTFMPELFPGGKVGFPSHGLMMYIDQVTHTFDYTSGFTTVAQLSAPSVMHGGNDADLPPNMISALIEPIREDPLVKSESHKQTNQGTKKKKPSAAQGGIRR